MHRAANNFIPFTNAVTANTASNGAALTFNRLHPTVLERVACVFSAVDGATYHTDGSSADSAWTNTVVGCSLAVEVFQRSQSSEASAVAIVLTQNQLLVVTVEGPAEVGHAITLHLGVLKELITQRIAFAHTTASRTSSDGSTQHQTAHPGVLHTVAIKYQQNQSRGAPSTTVLLHFPSSLEFDHFTKTLKATMETLYPHHPIGWSETTVDGDEALGELSNGFHQRPGHEADADAFTSQLTTAAAVPGTLLDRIVLRDRAPCHPTDIEVSGLLWSAADRIAAQTFGGFYSSATTASQQQPLLSSRANMVGPAVATAITDDDLQRAKHHLDAVEASVLLNYERLSGDIKGAICYARDASLRQTKAHHSAMMKLVESEQQRLNKDIIGMESEVSVAQKTLTRRQKEHSDTQVDSYAELSQWSHLEQDCRRIEVQRLQAVKDAQQRNFDSIADSRESNVRLNEELSAVGAALGAYESAAYTSVLRQHDGLVELLEEEDDRLKVANKDLRHLRLVTNKAERELNSTLAGLRRTIREATEEAMAARAKGEALLAEASGMSRDSLHQQALVERELERRLQGAAAEVRASAEELEEHRQILLDLEGRLGDAKCASAANGGDAASQVGRRGTSVFSNASNETGSSSIRQPFSAPFLSSAAPTKEIVRGNTGRWDLSFIPSAATPSKGRVSKSVLSSNSQCASESLTSPTSASARPRVTSARSSQSVDTSTPTQLAAAISPAQRRLENGSYYFVERAKVDLASEARIASERDAQRKVATERRLYSFS